MDMVDDATGKVQARMGKEETIWGRSTYCESRRKVAKSTLRSKDLRTKTND